MENEEMFEKIASIIELLEKTRDQLEKICMHMANMAESYVSVNGDVKNINQEMHQASLGLKAIAAEVTKAEPEPAKPIEVGDMKADDDYKEHVTMPVHRCDIDGKLAVCGAMGTASQPYAARMNEPVVPDWDKVTCPECLAKLAAQGKN